MTSLLTETLARPWAGLPRRTSGLAPVRGAMKRESEDFVVEELADGEPEGAGEHLYLWIEKRDVPATALLAHVAERLGVERSQLGYAGLKDTRAVTRQWVSAPARAEERVGAIDTEQIRVLRVARHGQKLRTGHLRGNRFFIRLRDVDEPGRALRLAAAVRERGFPNYFGAQRFGHGGSTLQLGLRLVRGEHTMRAGTLKRLALSSVQSALFNAYLASRIDDGLADTVLNGDVLLDTKLGTLSLAMDAAAEQKRCDAGRVVITGPMVGAKMRGGRADAAAREEALMQAAGLTVAAFNEHRALIPGTRRPLLVRVPDLEARAEGNVVELSFSHLAGA
jgi:tRNA pseudouridine13 synthase